MFCIYNAHHLLSMQAPENGSQGTPGRQCAQFVAGGFPSAQHEKDIM